MNAFLSLLSPASGSSSSRDLARPADEGEAFLVLLHAGSFSYQHDLGIVVSFAGNGVLPCLGEATPRAVPDAVRDGFKLGVQERPPSRLLIDPGASLS